MAQPQTRTPKTATPINPNLATQFLNGFIPGGYNLHDPTNNKLDRIINLLEKINRQLNKNPIEHTQICISNETTTSTSH